MEAIESGHDTGESIDEGTDGACPHVHDEDLACFDCWSERRCPSGHTWCDGRETTDHDVLKCRNCVIREARAE